MEIVHNAALERAILTYVLQRILAETTLRDHRQYGICPALESKTRNEVPDSRSARKVSGYAFQ